MGTVGQKAPTRCAPSHSKSLSTRRESFPWQIPAYSTADIGSAAMRRLLASVSLLCATGGCAFSFPDYPGHWAPIAQSSDHCASLSGSYKNKSWGLEGENNLIPALSEILFKGAIGKGLVERIDIKFGSDRILRVEAVRGSDVVATTEFSEQEETLACIKSGAEIHAYSGFTRTPGNPVVGHESESTTLARATDGAIIAKMSSGGFGLAYLLIPMGGEQVQWVRFPPDRD